jgi:hypothetical protein
VGRIAAMKILREPLFHFLLVGGALFGVFALIGPVTAGDSSYVITLTPGLIENLKLSADRADGRMPTADAMPGLIAAYVREEILCREARTIGLDRDDPVIRTLLVKRMEFLAESDVPVAKPSDAVLEAYFRQHRGDFAGADGRAAAWPEVRSQVEAAWQSEQRARAVDAAYERMRKRYRVIATPTATGSHP